MLKSPGRSDRHFPFTAQFFLVAMNQKSPLGRFPKLIRRLRPSFSEVEQYARAIVQHERRPESAWSTCVAEAEIQLWAIRSMLGGGNDSRSDDTGGMSAA